MIMATGRFNFGSTVQDGIVSKFTGNQSTCFGDQPNSEPRRINSCPRYRGGQDNPRSTNLSIDYVTESVKGVSLEAPPPSYEECTKKQSLDEIEEELKRLWEDHCEENGHEEAWITLIAYLQIHHPYKSNQELFYKVWKIKSQYSPLSNYTIEKRVWFRIWVKLRLKKREATWFDVSTFLTMAYDDLVNTTLPLLNKEDLIPAVINLNKEGQIQPVVYQMENTEERSLLLYWNYHFFHCESKEQAWENLLKYVDTKFPLKDHYELSHKMFVLSMNVSPGLFLMSQDNHSEYVYHLKVFNSLASLSRRKVTWKQLFQDPYKTLSS